MSGTSGGHARAKISAFDSGSVCQPSRQPSRRHWRMRGRSPARITVSSQRRAVFARNESRPPNEKSERQNLSIQILLRTSL